MRPPVSRVVDARDRCGGFAGAHKRQLTSQAIRSRFIVSNTKARVGLSLPRSRVCTRPIARGTDSLHGDRSSRGYLRRFTRTIVTAALVVNVLAAWYAPNASAQTRKQNLATITFPAPTWTDAVGPIAISSPTVATINGVDVVMFGSEDGYLYVVNAATGAPMPGWPQPVDITPGVPTAIESTPTLAYVHGPNRPPLIIVGAGSTYVAHQQGGLMAFSVTGQVRFRFHTMDIFNEWSGGAAPDGYDEGVIATPVVGDITGNGQQDIVFGSWDHRLYALNPSGKLVPGFPIDTQDTIWSSAALFHVRGKRQRLDIFVGGDASGLYHCHGGFIYDVTYTRHQPRIVWKHCENQTIWSSPAVGVITADGRPSVVVGTGFGETPPYRSGSYRLFAFSAKRGRALPGWPVTTTGPTFGSPAIGTLPGSTLPDVVDVSWCTACTGVAQGTSVVHAWSGTGALLWSQQLAGGQDFSSPIIADLLGNGNNDVLVGSSTGLYPLDGATGQYLFGTALGESLTNCSIQDAPAIADIPGTGPGTGWRLFVVCGGPHQITPSGRLLSYPLPYAPLNPPPWPMWRGNPTHNGVAP